jgi:hypothetical protein
MAGEDPRPKWGFPWLCVWREDSRSFQTMRNSGRFRRLWSQAWALVQ